MAAAQETAHEGRYRDIVESAGDLILAVDLDDRITAVNAAFERTLGYSRDEVIGRPLASIVAPAWRGQLRDATAVKLRRSSEQTLYDLELVADDGRTVMVEVSSWLVLEEGNPVGVQAICRDVSERRYTERALLQRAFEETDVGMFVTRCDGRIERANDAFCRLLGYSEGELQRLDVREITHPEDRADTSESLAQLADRAITRYRKEKRYICKNGDAVRVQIGVTPVADSTGTVVSLIAQVIDVTARRDAEAAVHETELLFRAAFDDAATGMLLTVAAGRIVRANAAFVDLLGYGVEELEQMSVLDITHSADRAVTREHIERMGRGEVDRVVFEKRYVRNDGSAVWVQIATSPVRDDASGEVTCFITQVVDLTARRESEARFRRLFESSPQGIAVVSRDGRVLEANPALGQILGRTSDELVGLSFTDFTHPDDCAVDVGLYAQLMAGDLAHYELEKRYVRKDGAIVWGHVTVFALPDPGKGPRVAIGILSDITERHALEEQLRQSQRMEAIGQLAGGVAHDFNNLLTAVTSYCDLATDALSDGREPLIQASVEGIRSAADRAAEVTQQLLAFSRRQVLELAPLDLNAAITDQMRFLRRLLGEDVEIRLALDPDVPAVTMDRGQLTQVVMNLAVNARDAMPGGGILTIETQNVVLDRAPTTTGLLSGPHVLLAVSDTGCGMDEATCLRAFEPFFTTKDSGKGTGLGLPTVLGIVEQSGGRVSVYSEPDLGTTFKVYMPSGSSKPATPAAPVAPATAARPLGSGTILLVEDNDAVRRPVARLLADLGYDTVEADGPEQALALAEGRTLDLIVTDVVMPGMNGRQLSEKLMSAQPGVKVLYMSGYTDDAVIARGVIEPGTAFLQKPFGVDRLAQKIRELLDA